MKTESMMAGFAAFAMTLAFTGCDVVDSSQVSSSTDFASYMATYDPSSNTAEFSAHFSVGGSLGTVIELSGNSSVSVDGAPMTEDRDDLFGDIYYDASEPNFAPSGFQQKHEFVFVDQNGATYRNDFSFPSPVALASGQALSGSLSSGLTVNWVAHGSSLSGDSVTATLTMANGGSTAKSEWAGNSGTISFDANDLQNLGGGGNAQLTLCDTYESSGIQADSDGGELTVSTCSQPYVVVLN